MTIDEQCDHRVSILEVGRGDTVLADRFEGKRLNSPYNPGGIVRLGVKVAPDVVTLEVSDTGAGIPADDLPHVFDRFYRVTHGQRRGREHAGLGLVIAKSILDLHDTVMTVRSEESVGKVFSFPLRRMAETPG